MVTKAPPPESLSPESRERMAELSETIEEDDAPPSSRNGDTYSLLDLEPETQGFRFMRVKIFGIAKKVRLRSLTARQFEKIGMDEDRNILLHSMCDDAGHLWFFDQDADEEQQTALKQKFKELIDRYDARTYVALISAANMHCLGRGGLDDMIQESAGN